MRQFIIATFCISLLSPAVGYPCINSVMSSKKATKIVKKMELLVEKGQYKKASELGHRRFEMDGELFARAELLQHVAVMRTWRNHSPKASTVRSFVDFFNGVLSREKTHPEYLARYAEALSLSDKMIHQERARAILERLYQDDLVPDAYSWALLAMYRAQGGWAEAATEAMSRCEAMTKHKKPNCVVPTRTTDKPNTPASKAS